MYCKKITLKSGKEKWECVEDGPADPVTGKRKQIRRRGKTRKEAREKVERAIRSLKEDSIDENIAKKVTFEMAANRFLEIYKMSGVKESSVLTREGTIKMFNKHVAKVPMTEFTSYRYQNLINKIYPKYNRKTVQNFHNCANMIFKQAIRDKIIKENPTRDVVIPKKAKTLEEIETDPVASKYLTHKEVEDFLQTAQFHGLRNDVEWFTLLAFSGTRPGEMLVLKWSDLNFDTNEISITKTLFNPKGHTKKYKLTPPKTKGSIRKIVIEQEVMDLLKSLQRRQKKFNMKYRHEIEDFHDEGFVFTKENGYPYNLNTLGARMKRLMERSSIKKHATPHIFRHTHVSMMAEAGVDIRTIMEKVGHEDMKTTSIIYTHVTEKMKKDASMKVRDVYKDVLSNLDLK